MAINKGIVGIGDAGGSVVASDNFNPLLYNGNSTSDTSTSLTQSVTGVGFQPDLVWIKARSVSYSHGWFDSVRGATNYISSNTTSSQGSSAGYLKSFDSDGFGLGGDFAFNRNPNPYVAWCWKAGGAAVAAGGTNLTNRLVSANPAAGFSIMTYTGNSSDGTISHGLTQKPELWIFKNLTNAKPWFTLTNVIDGSVDYAFLNENDGWNDAGQGNSTDTVLTVNNDGGSGFLNANNDNYVAYAWHSVDGYSKIGSYEGNGSSSGQTITGLGFDPTFVMLKAVDSSAAWRITDSARGDNRYIYANLATVYPNDVGSYVSLITDGFKLNGLDSNQSQTFIYMAFA